MQPGKQLLATRVLPPPARDGLSQLLHSLPPAILLVHPSYSTDPRGCRRCRCRHAAACPRLAPTATAAAASGLACHRAHLRTPPRRPECHRGEQHARVRALQQFGQGSFMAAIAPPRASTGANGTHLGVQALYVEHLRLPAHGIAQGGETHVAGGATIHGRHGCKTIVCCWDAGSHGNAFSSAA